MNANKNSGKDSALANKPAKEKNLKMDEAMSPAYLKPVLVCYGDVRDVTLGGSSVIPETGPFGPDGCKSSGQALRGCLP